MPRPLITLLTDFGLRDHYVAVMKGVMLGICPEASFVDISHEIEPFNIHQAAWTLLQAWEFFPPGTVHLVVVDPGVGSRRLPLVASTAGHFFVGPDNGVLAPSLEAGSQPEVYEINVTEYARKPLSNTFHGRDIFAPVAAHVAAGHNLYELGRPIENYIRSGFAKPIQTAPGRWTGVIVNIDRFGNIITNFEWDLFSAIATQHFEIIVGAQAITSFRKNYSDAASGEYFVIRGSLHLLEISLGSGHAADHLGLKTGISLDFRLY